MSAPPRRLPFYTRRTFPLPFSANVESVDYGVPLPLFNPSSLTSLCYLTKGDSNSVSNITTNIMIYNCDDTTTSIMATIPKDIEELKIGEGVIWCETGFGYVSVSTGGGVSRGKFIWNTGEEK